MHLRRENMWRGFHKIRTRTSAMFRSQWEVYLESAGKGAIPTFYQFVTNEFFIKLKHPFDRKESEASHVISMEHKNALRYVAGHVC